MRLHGETRRLSMIPFRAAAVLLLVLFLAVSWEARPAQAAPLSLSSLSGLARVALGNIVLNRVNSTTDWGHVNTIKDVIYDTKWCRQFDCTAPKKKLGGDTMMDRAFLIYETVSADEEGSYQPWQINGMAGCIEVAKDVMCGKKAVPDSFVYCRGEKYFKTDIASCKETGRRYLIIEKHIYYEN